MNSIIGTAAGTVIATYLPFDNHTNIALGMASSQIVALGTICSAQTHFGSAQTHFGSAQTPSRYLSPKGLNTVESLCYAI